MPRYKTFKISIPTDAEGFIGRACDAPGCKQYFKIVCENRDLRFGKFNATAGYCNI